MFKIDNPEKKRLAKGIIQAEYAAFKYYHAQKCDRCRFKKAYKKKGRK